MTGDKSKALTNAREFPSDYQLGYWHAKNTIPVTNTSDQYRAGYADGLIAKGARHA